MQALWAVCGIILGMLCGSEAGPQWNGSATRTIWELFDLMRSHLCQLRASLKDFFLRPLARLHLSSRATSESPVGEVFAMCSGT